MPMYEYYCSVCKAQFEKLRTMAESDETVRCSAGHTGVRRLVSVFAMGGRSMDAVPAGGGGGCCGGGCACGQN